MRQGDLHGGARKLELLSKSFRNRFSQAGEPFITEIDLFPQIKSSISQAHVFNRNSITEFFLIYI